MRFFLKNQKDHKKDGKLRVRSGGVNSFQNHLKFKLPQIANEIDLGSNVKIDRSKLNSKSLTSFK